MVSWTAILTGGGAQSSSRPLLMQSMSVAVLYSPRRTLASFQVLGKAFPLMQCAAVKTYFLLMSTPPHSKPRTPLAFSYSISAIQGNSSRSVFLPTVDLLRRVDPASVLVRKEVAPHGSHVRGSHPQGGPGGTAHLGHLPRETAVRSSEEVGGGGRDGAALEEGVERGAVGDAFAVAAATIRGSTVVDADNLRHH
jgi:hypothetical protein